MIRENKRKSEHDRRRRNILAYSLGTLGLVLLITAAFFGPRIVFAMQDDIRCGAVVSMSPEEVDITSFNTGYETDLYKRLERFAKGLAEDRQYYVTVQDMELTTEIMDWVSEQGYYQESFQMLVFNLELIPEEMFFYELISWKRCVIYGDDFAGGVNFILWYLELGNDDKPVVRLLVDGETGELYGVRTNFDAYLQDERKETRNILLNLVDSYNIYTDEIWYWSFTLGNYYGGLQIYDMLSWLTHMGCGYYPVDDVLYVDIPADYEDLKRERAYVSMSVGKAVDSDWADRYSVEEIQDFLKRLRWQISEDGNCLDFDFPYHENILKFRVSLDGEVRWLNKSQIRFLDITFGFPEIYEKITVFMEDWN